MKNDLLKVSIRQNAIFIPEEKIVKTDKNITQATAALVANIRKMGYTVSEELLHALNGVTPNYISDIFETLKEVLGTDLNWAPLVKGWDTPTGESRLDHIITFFANAFKGSKGLTLQCGHLIPENTFPMERYNGCPYCGTPFVFGKIENYGQGSKLKVLELWTDNDLQNYFKDLLSSRTALDATQIDSLKILLGKYTLPDVEIAIKETVMVVIDTLVEQGDSEKAKVYFTTPNDILRYLWYKKTGFLQIVEPKTIVKRTAANNKHLFMPSDKSKKAGTDKKEELKLKYSRQQCRMVASWLNELNLDAEKACEIMHSKRNMWVRFIRALRLAEYSKKEEFANLQKLMDVFYNQSYTVWQGDVNHFRLKADMQNSFELLKQRPGLFARSLFANILWFGSKETLEAFEEVMDKVPARLLFTLNMYAQNYFDPNQKRTVKPLGGTSKVIKANKLVSIYTEDQLKEMISDVEELCIKVVAKRFTNIPTKSKTIYIDPMLFNIPLSIGDRSEMIQDTSCALMGTRFPVEGNAVRLFMQWGKGLPAQHLDMDLSCQIVLASGKEVCSYYNLVATGAKHSGDIISIPDKVGAAEYIELDLNVLSKAAAKYVIFTCNAYSNGAISPNLVVGWMNSAHKMTISNKTGVAYDPSCVQHQVRISQGLAKGLVFGVLDVQSREIIWLEMPFGGQIVANMNATAVETLLKKLQSKTTIGNLLSIKANAQSLSIVDSPEADEAYTMQWALNTAAVTKLLID